MKIKTDFTTNSSSASFVVAVKKDFTVEDIKNELLKNRKALRDFIKENEEYWEDERYDDDIMEIMETKKLKDREDILADKLAQRIGNKYSMENALEIGEFKVYALSASSEEISLFPNWLFSYSDMRSDELKTDNLRIEIFN